MLKATLQLEMAYPPNYHPIKNYAMFTCSNWTWASPGARGNICDQCGTDCFCDAKNGLLPRKRGRGGVVSPAPGSDAAAPLDAENAIPGAEEVNVGAGAEVEGEDKDDRGGDEVVGEGEAISTEVSEASSAEVSEDEVETWWHAGWDSDAEDA